jgi:hypothetical protein
VSRALFIATSVPVPIAMPTSACASAGASFTPSPAIATSAGLACSFEHVPVLVLRQHAGLHLVDARAAADRRGRAGLSPVSITIRTPLARSCAMASGVDRLHRVGDAHEPARRPSTATNITVCPTVRRRSDLWRHR